MPHSTHAYPFESKVDSWACSVSRVLAGEDRTFLLVFNEQGQVKALLFDEPEPSWTVAKRRLADSNQPFLFYDPFDAPVYTWLEWFNVERPLMERLMQQRFDDADFVRQPFCPHTSEALRSYPATWGVMF